MKIFVSSTCYDLIDIRAEIAAMLKEMGLSPVMSDRSDSDFDVEPSKSSIESCLVNVDACEVVIVILDKRYGPRLTKYGFPDLSATHLEYRRAISKGKAVFVFVRDHTMAECDLWKRDNNVPCLWVREPTDRSGLFPFILEHTEPPAGTSRNNWVTTFIDSLDLKDAVCRRIGPIIRPKVIREAIAGNSFPLVAMTFDTAINSMDLYSEARVTLQNVSNVPALNVELTHAQGPAVVADRSFSIMAPGQAVVIPGIVEIPPGNLSAPGHQKFVSARYALKYTSNLAVDVSDAWEITVEKRGQVMLSEAKLIEQQRFEGKSPHFKIHPKPEVVGE